MAKTTKEQLREFLAIPGVKGVAIVGRDGFVIEHVSVDKLDIDALGAVVASAIGAAEMIGRDFSMGKLDQYLLEFAGGKTIIATAGDYVLAIMTEPSAIIGSVRYAVKKGIDGLTKAL
jgi:predicted regulator of Ras-like GTPase activity (Roadblock/LC7/MglB family)